MISEERLKAAAAEADQAILHALPAGNDFEHEFSKSFEKKIRRISRRVQHPILYRLPKQIACVLLIAVLTGTSWLTFDVEARATFFAWVKAQYELFVEYRFVGDVPQEGIAYELTWLPDGFERMEQYDLNSGGSVHYTTASGQRIIFYYSRGNDVESLFVLDYSEIIPVEVNGRPADFYLSSSEDEANGLVWMSADEETLFCIVANQPQETLVKIAERVGQVDP